MEQMILDIALCFIEYSAFFLFLNSLLEKRFQNYFPLISVILIGAAVMFFCQDFSIAIKSVMGLAILITGSSILFKERVVIKTSYSLMLLFFVYIIDIIIGNICALVIDENFANVFYSDFKNRVILCLIAKVFDIMILFIAQKAFRRIYNNLKTKYWCLFGTVFLVLFMAFFVFMYFYFDMQKDTKITTMFLFISVSFLVMSWIVIYFFTEICSGFQKDNKMLVLERNNKALEEALVMQKSNSQSFKKIRHDFTNHTTNALALLECGRTNEAAELLKSVGIATERILPKHYVNSGNTVVDAIISSKAALCESKGILFTYKIEPLEKIKIETVDLSSLLSNLLDNAIEAAEKTTNGFIKIDIFKYKAYYGICVENSFLGKESIAHSGSHLLSTKSEKEMHGYGTRIIEEIAEKYHGNSVWNADGGSFKSNILLKI